MDNSQGAIESIPISEIRVLSPRSRDKVKFQLVVSSIDSVGLKRPVTVAKRAKDSDGTRYDLVCGQGRIEALQKLGQSTVPAIVIDAPEEDRLLMSLIENIARRPSSHRDLIREVLALKARKKSQGEIALKLGMSRVYIAAVVRLVERGEASLVAAVEAGRLPMTVALEIARGDDAAVQKALASAYESGKLRGDKLATVRRMIAKR